MHYMTFHDVITTQFGFGENVKKTAEWLSNVLLTRELTHVLHSLPNGRLPEAPPITIAILPNFDKLQSGSMCVMRDFCVNLTFYTVCQMVHNKK